MTRRLRRHKDFTVQLEIRNDDFVRPPREAQRQWLLNRAVEELVDQLEHVDRQSREFVAGADAARFEDRSQAELDDQDLMEDWQIPVMRAMARVAAADGGDVLEVGFGRGISADFIQDEGVRSHTIVECNDGVVARFRSWRERYPDRDIRLLHGRWQDVTDQLEQYDAIFFHTYPLNEDEYIEHVVQSVTFAEHFFPTAAAHLRSGGVFTYLTQEIDSLSRAHQRLLLRHFRRVTLEVVGPLSPPEDSRDVLWGSSMVVVGAER